MANKVKLVIFGETYWIRGEEPEERLKEVASLLTSALSEVEERYPYLDAKEKLLALALSLAEKLVRLKLDLAGIGKKVEECLTEE